MIRFLIPWLLISVFISTDHAQTPSESNSDSGKASQGPAIDKSGDPVIDPTKNVLDLVIAAQKREDDLRMSAEKLIYAEIRRIDDLRVAENKRIDERHSEEAKLLEKLGEVRAYYEDKLRKAESDRINDLRGGDNAQAQALVTQVSTTAETLRALVATTAAAADLAAQRITTQVNDRLALLEKSQYEIRGRAGVADPALDQLATAVARLEKTQSTVSGKSEGSSVVWGWVVGGLGLVIAMFSMMNKRTQIV